MILQRNNYFRLRTLVRGFDFCPCLESVAPGKSSHVIFVSIELAGVRAIANDR